MVEGVGGEKRPAVGQRGGGRRGCEGLDTTVMADETKGRLCNYHRCCQMPTISTETVDRQDD